MVAQADHHLLRVGRRRAGAARIDRVGRDRTPRSCSSTPWCTSTPTATAAASSRWRARTCSSISSTTWRATSQDPETHLTRLEAAAGHGDRRGPSRTRRRRSASRADLRIGALGSGSDYTPFLQHLGVASLNIGYGGEDENGIYHSIYDDFYFYTHFLDTDFTYGRTLAQTGGTAVMRLADADILPFHYANLADTVRTYADELQDLLKKRQDEIRERNREIADGVFAAVNDPAAAARGAEDRDRCRRRSNFAPIARAVDALARQRGGVRRGEAPRREEAPRPPRALAAIDVKIARVRAAAARRRRPRCVATGSSTCCTRRASTPATA